MLAALEEDDEDDDDEIALTMALTLMFRLIEAVLLAAATAAKLPPNATWSTGDEEGLLLGSLGAVESGLLGVLLTSADLLLTVDAVLFPLVLKMELLLLFIVALEARTAIGFIGYKNSR